MNENDKIYRKLQKHLDRQAVSFPATKSGAEIRILKRLFSVEEAKLAMSLSYQPNSIEDIYDAVKPPEMSMANMQKMLDGMVAKRAIGRKLKENSRYYFVVPFVVGIYELQVGKLTPDFVADVDQYFSDQNFGLAMLSTKLPQMRTIPIEKSIQVDHHITTYDNVREIINGTNGPIGISECICRQKKSLKGNPCHKTSRLETCMILGDWARVYTENGMARAISKAEALEIMRQNEAEGLVLQPSNDQKVEFICACCGCCCGMLGLQKMLPKPVAFWATNYYAAVESANCTSCGTCVERCQVNAARIDEKAGVAKINLDRCIGCGNCVATCPSGALSLVKKKKETVPPQDMESLYDTIAANKPGTLGKIKLLGRLALKR
jgi:electron transport complex protein RnfB